MLPQFVRPTPRPGEVPQSAASRLPHRRDYAHCPPDQCECLTAGPFRAGAAFPGTRHFCIHVTWPKLSGSACAEYVPKHPLLSVVVQVKADSWAVPKVAPRCRETDQAGMHSHRDMDPAWKTAPYRFLFVSVGPLVVLRACDVRLFPCRRCRGTQCARLWALPIRGTGKRFLCNSVFGQETRSVSRS
jgi:hypothetical protein